MKQPIEIGGTKMANAIRCLVQTIIPITLDNLRVVPYEQKHKN